MAKSTATKEVQPDLLGGPEKSVVSKKSTAQAVKKIDKAKPARAQTKAREKAPEIAKPAMTKGHLTVIKNNPTNTLAVLTAAMSGKNAANLQIVAALHKEMIAEQARLDYIEAKRQMKRMLPIINKDGLIEYRDKGDGKGKPKPLGFATYEKLHDACADPMFEHGFDITHAAQPGVPGMINVVTTLVHTNGHFEQSVLPMPHDASGGKSGAQGWASAFSFGKRINMIGLLDIVTRAVNDRDLDGNTAKRNKKGDPMVIDGDVVLQDGIATIPLITTAQQDKLVEALEAKGVSRQRFCAVYKINKIDELPAADYADALQRVLDFEPVAK